MGWPGRASCTDVALAVVVLLIVASVTTPTAMPTRLTDAVSAPPSASPCADVAHDRTFVVTNGVNSSGESQAAFEKVYRERLWGTEGGGSGPGSEADATRNARIIIELVVHKYKVHRIVDAPCGAMAWMPLLLEKLHAAVPCFSYLGVDVARPVIAANAQRFVTVPWMAFRAVDFSTELLPGPPPDLIFCRDALQHLSMRLVLGALNTFAAALGGSRDRYLLVGSYERGRNQNIITGEYFDIDLRLPPFSLKPQETFHEVQLKNEKPKMLLLYSGAQLAAIDTNAIRSNATAMQMWRRRRLRSGRAIL